MFIVRICGKLRGKINKKSHGENIVGKVFKAAVMFTVAACMFTSYVGAENKSYIKWVDFKVTAQALSDAAALDIGGYGKDGHVGWIDALAHLGAKYGGDFSRYKKAIFRTHLQNFRQILPFLTKKNIILITGRRMERCFPDGSANIMFTAGTAVL